MQLILTQDVPHLGSLGDEVRVKDGYARNFLLPRGMAIMAGRKNLAQIEHRRKQLEVLRQQAIESARSESEKVAGLEIAVQAKAGANGRLFGSVTNRDIQAVLAENGYTLDRRSIVLHTPIRNVGTFGATVRLHTDVKVDVEITVTPLAGKDGEGEVPAEGEATEAPAGAELATEGAAEGEAPAEGDPAAGDAAAGDGAEGDAAAGGEHPPEEAAAAAGAEPAAEPETTGDDPEPPAGEAEKEN